MIVAASELAHVPTQVLLRHVVVGAVVSAFQERPEALYAGPLSILESNTPLSWHTGPSNATGFGNGPSFELFINKGAPRVQRRGDGVVLAGAVDEVE